MKYIQRTMNRRNRVIVKVVLVTIILTGLPTRSTYLYGQLASTVRSLANRFFSVNHSTQTETAEDVGHQINGTWDVLINTYMRSGSTFLGRILGWRSDSFYLYEPLWNPHRWEFFSEDGRLCYYLTPTCSENDTYASTSLQRAKEFLKDFYQCRLAIHSDFIYAQLHAIRTIAGPSWEPFRSCRKQQRSDTECISEMEPTCQTAKHRVAKLLRMDFLHMSEFLSVLPRLKIVLLLRDPRGILNSHLHTKWFPMQLKAIYLFENDVKVVCSRMQRDLQTASLLTKRFRDRVKIVQYEALEDTFEGVNSLYRFMGMGQINNETFSNIFPGSVQKDPFSFRNTMSWDAVNIIDKHCSNLYGKLGLVQYKDQEHLRNRTVPSIIGKLPYTLQ